MSHRQPWARAACLIALEPIRHRGVAALPYLLRSLLTQLVQLVHCLRLGAYGLGGLQLVRCSLRVPLHLHGLAACLPTSTDPRCGAPAVCDARGVRAGQPLPPRAAAACARAPRQSPAAAQQRECTAAARCGARVHAAFRPAAHLRGGVPRQSIPPLHARHSRRA